VTFGGVSSLRAATPAVATSTRVAQANAAWVIGKAPQYVLQMPNRRANLNHEAAVNAMIQLQRRVGKAKNAIGAATQRQPGGHG
jgi:hypothetical protein